MPTNLVDIINIQLNKKTNKTAIYYKSNPISYQQLYNDISKLSFFLSSKGLKKNDVVFHDFNDEYLTILAMLSAAQMGITFVSLPKELHLDKLEELISQTNAKYFLNDKNITDSELISINIKHKDFCNYKEYKKEYFIESSSIWQIVVGSGTTGKPKLFEVSQSLELKRIEISKESTNISESDVVASLIKMNFNSTKIRFLATLFSGGSYLIFEDEVFDFINHCKKYKISVLHTSVYHVEKILSNLQFNAKESFSFLRVLSLGGSSISEELKNRIKKHLCKNLYITYGTNEIGGISSTKPNTVYKTKQTVGFILSDVKVQIVDENDNKLPVNSIGHIRVKSSGMISSYLNDEVNTNKYFKNGWFYPRDIGMINESNELIHYGRSDRMMIVNGINIHPSLIENRLLEHELVCNAICVSLKDEKLQDIPICAVEVTLPGKITTAELLNFCSSKLKFSSAHEIVFLDKISKNDLGKINLEEIKEEIYKKLLKNTKKYTVTLEKINIFNMDLLDSWLLKVFDINTSSLNNKNDIYSMCQRAILLIERFCHIVQIPVYGNSEVSRIEENENSYNIQLRLSYIDQIPLEHYINILNNSFKYLYQMLNIELTFENIDFIVNRCADELLKPILSTMPQGSYRVVFFKEVFKKKIPYFHLGSGIYQLGWGSKSKKFDRSSTSSDSAMGQNISANKIVSANMLKMANLPAPIHGFANNYNEALSIANEISYPVVIKPIDMERGEGVSVNIYSKEQLFNAFDRAYNLSISKKVIVEKQVRGVCHRVFISNNKLLYAVKRLPIGVYADGVNSIETLINIENEKESNKFFWEQKYTFFKDDYALSVLKQNGFNLTSIPKKEVFIPLREIETTEDGGIDEDVTSIIHKDNIDIAIQAANLFELDVAGVDIITEDISKPWHKTETIINEVNYAPALGAGEISKKSLGQYLDNYISDEGRIPIEIFIGNEDNIYANAKLKQEEYVKKGYNCYLVTQSVTLNEQNDEIYFYDNSFIPRCNALLLNSKVDALIVVDSQNIFYNEYSPFDKIKKVNFV
ncbi:AMP-binding protein [Poseidonibacter sp.]|uniref:AMP-binding protein n=1 Tax=Poseidonibacter sp. TaxID=2321188 RepID=UPI003C71CAC0